MTYIKKIVMQGFKSFARKTEIPLENSMNIIVGPNGSGKSNITDALCFVLGRLSIKSIRAAKAANLLFSGNKNYKGSNEAFVEIIFDNTDKTFSINSNELTIKRIVRKNGLSIYKINNETKTRQELIELLAQGGIDPNGFNIVLQGEIQSLVKSTSEERRQIIEEVAGISIYETRKHKSLRELEKAEESLKEVSAILRERNAFLKNLEKEKQEAISHQKLEETIKKCKATIISKNIKEKEKEIWGINKIIENYEKEIDKIKKEINMKNLAVEELQNKIYVINKQIQSSTSNEQENLHKELSDLKADLAGLTVRLENYENRKIQGNEKISQIKEKISKLNEEISQIQKNSPEIKKQKELSKNLQEKFDILEQQRRKFYMLKSEISTFENKKEEKEKSIIENEQEIKLLKNNIESLANEIKYEKDINQIEKIKEEALQRMKKIEQSFAESEKEILEKEKNNAILEKEIEREEKLREDVIKLQNCPICKQEVTQDHKHKISFEANEKILNAKKELAKNLETKEEDKNKISSLKEEISKLNFKINELNIDKIKIKNIDDKKNQIEKIRKEIEENRNEISRQKEKLQNLKNDFEKLKDVEEKYDEARLKLQEISFQDINIDTEVTVKEREINRLTVDMKKTIRDIEDSLVEIKKISILISEKEKLLAKKENEEQQLYEKFQKFFSQKNEIQDKQKAIETDIIGLSHTIKNLEDKTNSNKIQKAQFSAQMESLKSEISEFGNVEIFQFPIEEIKDRLQKAQFKISQLGSVNMRALEIFEQVQEQCESIKKKVETIENEKSKIQNIISEIDKKKKKAFFGTLNSVNEFFTRNFKQLSKKGEVFLEIENKKEPFQGGLNILVKVSRGKYFDVTSLSGGEKTLVALSLIFAIQEYSPYSFYIFDEIDAALDKHNSELLAALIKKYKTTGQYIIITHNDTLISEATSLYGVSMQENISKVVSLKV
ncbi:MAG: chromosome segregation SMC family protein [Candidatus Pacearchaeota archaeon]